MSADAARRAEAARLEGAATAAFDVCVALAALPPPSDVAQYVAAGHARIVAGVGSTSGFVGLGVRRRPAGDDPLLGWRIALFYGVGRREEAAVALTEQVLADESYVHDPIVQSVVADAGRSRVYHDPDPRTDRSLRGTLNERFYRAQGIADRLKFVCTVSPGVEIHGSADRPLGSPRFEPADVVFLEHVVRGLGPWARRVALLHGHLEGCDPLSPREREVACALLGVAPIKVFAGPLAMGEARAREITRAVYRKLRVASRAELASRWAGEPTTEVRHRVVASQGRTARGATGRTVTGGGRVPPRGTPGRRGS